MRLEKLSVEGFKTFKNKATVEFLYKYTAVVGPNGSGKSNLIDALCFVIGRSRGMRTDKLAELIYNGGTNGNQLDQAIVSAYFSEASTGDLTGEKTSLKITSLRSEIFKNGFLKITRIVKRDGKTHYKINDKNATKEKVIELIGGNEYNVLLQDDITNFIEMNPRERRCVIDEICGIANYDEKKSDAIKELVSVEEKISEAHVKLNEKIENLNILEKEKSDAIKFKEIKNEILLLELSLNYINLKDDDRKITSYEKEIMFLHDALERCNVSEKSIKEMKKEFETKISSINKSLIELTSKHKESDYSLLNTEQRYLKASNKKYADLNEKINFVVQRKAELNDIDNSLSAEIKKITERIKEVDEILKVTKVTEIENDVMELKDKIYDKKIAVGDAKNKYEWMRKAIEEKTDKINLKRSEIDILINREQEIAREIDDKSYAYKEIFEAYTATKKEKFNTEKEYEKLIAEYEKIKSEYVRHTEILKNLKKSTIADNLKKVVQGVHGTVSELCKVSDAKYRKAIYAAAGNRMENIVVADEDAAIKCINILKASKIGRATFLPLNKINPNLVDEKSEGICFARDVLLYGEKLKGIIAYIFRNTIIVNTAYDFKPLIGRYRMVSLDGDIAEKEGALSGGFIKETLNFNEISNEIKRLEGKLRDIEEKIEKVKERKNVNTDNIEKKISNCQIELEKLKIEKKELSVKREENEIEISMIENEIENMEEEGKKIKLLIENAEKEIFLMSKTLEKIENEIKDEEYEKIENLKNERRNLEIELVKKQKDADFSKVQISELQIDELLNERKQIEDTIRETTERIEKIKLDLKKKDEENKEIDVIIQRLEEERKKVEEKVTKLNIDMDKVSEEKDEIRNNIEKIQIEKGKVEEHKKILLENIEKSKDVAEDEIKKFIEDHKVDEQSNKEYVMNKINELKNKMISMGDINLRAIESYDEAKKGYDEIFNRVEILKNERQAIYDFIASVERKRRDVFMNAYEKINVNFEKIFKKLTDGYGTLTLDNPKDISISGLHIHASPKGKNITKLDAMSGGEKALTCAAFLLAIQQYSPAPFYVLDEIDASLDLENSIKIAKLLKESDGQFIIVTHNENVIKYADAAIGVSMQNGASHIVGVKINF